MGLLMVVGSIADQDLGQPVDLLHQAVDLAVLGPAYGDVSQLWGCQPASS